MNPWKSSSYLEINARKQMKKGLNTKTKEEVHDVEREDVRMEGVSGEDFDNRLRWFKIVI